MANNYDYWINAGKETVEEYLNKNIDDMDEYNKKKKELIEKMIKPEIKVGAKVRRINSEHGSMKIGDIAIVTLRNGTCIHLDKDAHRAYEHDVRFLELVH